MQKKLKLLATAAVMLLSTAQAAALEIVWNEIDSLNQSLTNATDTTDILLDRAELFFSIRQYDAVLYDLGAVSKMGSANDSLYFTSTVSSLYQGGGRQSVEILTDMMEHFRTMKDLH